MDYYQSLKKSGVFVPPFICKFVLDFYDLVNGPVDNTVVRPSRVRGEREKKREDRIDKRCKHSRSLSY